MLLVLGSIYCLIVSSWGQSPITFTNGDNTQSYYLSVWVNNIDASSCGDTVSGVDVYINSNWVGNDQTYDNRFAWDYKGTRFDQALPLSFRIRMSSSRTLTFWAVITNMNGGETFTPSDSQLICDGTATPTPAPVPRPTQNPTAPTTPYPTSESICVDASPSNLQWRSYGNQLIINGNRFNMKGLSWFGFETGNYGLYGLDRHNADWYFQWMQDRGFNAMRLPFSKDYLDRGTSALNDYRDIIRTAANYGIMVMPDFHSVTAGSWTDGFDTVKNDIDRLLKAPWVALANHLKDEWNVFIADIFNEPHDVDNNEWAEWLGVCQDVAEAIWDTGVNWMVAIEGTNYDCGSLGSPTSCAWGENLMGARSTPFTYNTGTYGANRFIYSPHVYGADVTGNGNYGTSSWNLHWGYLADLSSNEAASVIGEFGTTYQGGMVNWLNSLVDYLVSIDQRNTFFWCLNPNSGDTGGLLQSDWTTDEAGKLAQLDELQPNPSVITYNSNTGRVCFSQLGDGGSAPAPATQPASNPVPSPTDPPTDPPVSTGDRIRVSVKSGANKWWYAVTLDDTSGVSRVQMKDDRTNTWRTGTAEWDYYKWTNGQPFEGPFSFRITVNGNRYTSNNCITNTAVDTSDYCYVNIGQAFTDSDSSAANRLEWPAIFAIVVSCLVFIACVVGIILCWRKRAKNQGQVSFQQSKADTPNSQDRDGADTNKDDADTITPPVATQTDNGDNNEEDDAEIEVEMNVHYTED